MFRQPTPPPRPASDRAEDIHRWALAQSDYQKSLSNYLRVLAADVRDMTERQQPAYTVTNLTTDRVFDADATSTAELADVLGTLIDDLNMRST